LYISDTQSLNKQHNGYKSNLFAAAESGGFGVLISPLLIFIKKIADTTYCGPPFFHG
jgi:hypothetical protein